MQSFNEPYPVSPSTTEEIRGKSTLSHEEIILQVAQVKYDLSNKKMPLKQCKRCRKQ